MKSIDEISLKHGEQKALRAAYDELKEQFPIEKIILFGSKARGEGDEYSDLDLLMISSRPLHWREEKAIIGILFDIGTEYDVIFSALFTCRDEWDKGVFEEFPLHEEIIRDGALIS